jgi:hypothetical protein
MKTLLVVLIGIATSFATNLASTYLPFGVKPSWKWIWTLFAGLVVASLTMTFWPDAPPDMTGFPPTEESFFTASKIGRFDIVSTFMDQGFSPYLVRRDDQLRMDGTALGLAMYWKPPNICALVKIYKKHNVDVSSFKAAAGEKGGKTPLDMAIAAGNVDAIRCLKASYANIDEYAWFLSKRIRILKALSNSPGDSMMSAALTNCMTEIPHLFGRPEQIVQLRKEQGAYFVAEFSETTCMFRTVDGFKAEIARTGGFAPMIENDEQSLSALMH